MLYMQDFCYNFFLNFFVVKLSIHFLSIFNFSFLRCFLCFLIFFEFNKKKTLKRSKKKKEEKKQTMALYVNDEISFHKKKERKKHSDSKKGAHVSHWDYHKVKNKKKGKRNRNRNTKVEKKVFTKKKGKKSGAKLNHRNMSQEQQNKKILKFKLKYMKFVV